MYSYPCLIVCDAIVIAGILQFTLNSTQRFMCYVKLVFAVQCKITDVHRYTKFSEYITAFVGFFFSLISLTILLCIKLNENYIRYSSARQNSLFCGFILCGLHMYRDTQKNNDALWLI